MSSRKSNFAMRSNHSKAVWFASCQASCATHSRSHCSFRVGRKQPLRGLGFLPRSSHCSPYGPTRLFVLKTKRKVKHKDKESHLPEAVPKNKEKSKTKRQKNQTTSAFSREITSSTVMVPRSPSRRSRTATKPSSISRSPTTSI